MTDIGLDIPPFLQRAPKGVVQMKTIENTAPASDVAIRERTSVALITPMDMIARAVEQGASMEVVEKLMALRERWDANEARKAFEAALAAAKAEIKPITKNRHVGFESKKPGAARTDYRHEDLAEVARTVDPVLAKHGLAYRYRTTVAPNEPITVTCIVFGHGHSEETTLSAGRDDSGNKNSIQQMGSTVTYLQRYTLKSALGLAASNDDDGKGADDKGAGGGACLSDEQVDQVNKLLIETKSNLVLFLKKIKLESLTEIRADKFDAAMDLIRENAKKRDAMQKETQA